jgi:outer membrane protein TolC
MESSNAAKMLPHLLVTGDLEERDNQRYSYSDVMGMEGEAPSPGATGTGVNEFSVGTERGTSRWTVELRWSPNEAALAYYLARSSRNDEMKQRYQRIRTAQRLIAVVDASFARLLGLQKAVPVAAGLLRVRREVALRMERLLKKHLVPVDNYYRAKEKLIKARRLAASVRNEAERQRNLLASAMQISPDRCVDGGFRLAGVLSPPRDVPCMSVAEMIAVKNRPESYVAGLNHLNSINDFKRTVVKYFPKITGFWKQTRDKDLYLYNKEWRDVGMMVYFDLMDWLSNRWENKAASRMARKTYVEIGAVALGIAAEVRSAVLKAMDAIDRLRAAESSLAAARKVWRIRKKRASRGVTQKVEELDSRGDVLEAQVELHRARGEAKATYAELQAAMGTNYTGP